MPDPAARPVEPVGERRLEDVIFQALTYEISDTAYLQRLSRKAAKAVMAHINDLAEAAMEEARCNCDTAPIGVGCPVHPEESADG